MALKTYGIVVRIGIVIIIFPCDVTNYCQVGPFQSCHWSPQLQIKGHHKIVTFQLWNILQITCNMVWLILAAIWLPRNVNSQEFLSHWTSSSFLSLLHDNKRTALSGHTKLEIMTSLGMESVHYSAYWWPKYCFIHTLWLKFCWQITMLVDGGKFEAKRRIYGLENKP